VLLCALRAVSVISLGLLAVRGGLLLRVWWLRRIVARRLWLLAVVAILRSRCRVALRVVVAHVAILLGALAVRGRLRRQRGRGNVARGRLTKRLAVVLRRRSPWIYAAGVVRVIGRVVHGGNEGSRSNGKLRLAVTSALLGW
jgi:hypothetical protein